MAAKGTTRRTKKISERRLKLRGKYWPEVTEDMLWSRKHTKGFVTMPRGLSLVMRIMNCLSPGKPLSDTYLTLWFYSFDEMFITIQKPRQMALESGFTGQRAENTWRTRMKILAELGFIKSQAGVTGDYHYTLLLNPYQIVKKLKDDGTNHIPENLYNTLVERIEEIGEVSII